MRNLLNKGLFYDPVGMPTGVPVLEVCQDSLVQILLGYVVLIEVSLEKS
jgi:hypothetical protein